MKYFFDTEFIEDGKTIDLISIGVVAEDGREFYRINAGCHFEKANQWVHENVLVHLPPFSLKERGDYRTHRDIAKELLEFVGDDTEPEFWADYAAYDWVALCQLFGRMLDLPQGWPMFCRDVQQFRKALHIPKFSILSAQSEHHALADARECKARYDYLEGMKP